MVESVLSNFEQGSLYPFYYNTFFEVLAYIVGITVIIACVYLNVFLIKKLIRLFKNQDSSL